MMAGADESAHGVTWARERPDHAIALLPVDGRLHVHSWNVATGEVIPATAAPVRAATIDPGGRWVWWFDQQWRRQPFGSTSARTAQYPIGLGRAERMDLLLGSDATAVVTRFGRHGQQVYLIPVAQAQFEAEPFFLGAGAPFLATHRSADDSLICVRTPAGARILEVRTSAEIAQIPAWWQVAAFTPAGGAQLLLQSRTDPHQLLVWEPGGQHDHHITVPLLRQVHQVGYDASGRRLVVHGRLDGRARILLLSRMGELLATLPESGQADDAVPRPDGALWARWWDAGQPPRFVDLDDPGRPLVGGYDRTGSES